MIQIPLTPTDPLGLPASVGFILFFKVLGFILHVIPMNIWYAGVFLSALFVTFGKGHLRTVGLRLIYPMPILVALGINFGIVPLLFTQVLFYPQYYTAGILIAWPWLLVIGFLMFAYYGVYFYSYQAKKGTLTAPGYAAGWISSIFFIFIGFLFTNNFSLMTNSKEWLRLFDQTNVAGAVTGLALNTSDPTLWPRWLLMFGMALTTTAVWILIDKQYFCRRESEGYRQYASKFAAALYTVGIIWMAGAGSWYILGTLPVEIFDRAMATSWVKFFFALAGCSALAPWTWILLKRNAMSKSAIWVSAALQLVVITSNAISRQWVQIAEIERFMPLSRDAVNWQWSPMVVFLVLFAVGLIAIGWMVRKIISFSITQSTSNR